MHIIHGSQHLTAQAALIPVVQFLKIRFCLKDLTDLYLSKWCHLNLLHSWHDSISSGRNYCVSTFEFFDRDGLE